MRTSTTRRSFLRQATVVFTTVAFPLSALACKDDREDKTNVKKSESVTHTVEIQQFKFVPAQITVNSGDSIKWINRDIVPHTATAVDGSWDTGQILKDESKIILFSKESSTDYYCFYHQSMKAELKIVLT